MFFLEASQLEFARWIDAFAPYQAESGSYGGGFDPVLRRKFYATSMDSSALLRPWMLGIRSDFSVSGGFIEPDVACIMMELIMTEGPLV